MAKGKRTPALFEIINRAQTEGQDPHLQIPGWWRSLSETAEVDRNLAPPQNRPPDETDADGNGRESSKQKDEDYDRMVSAVEEAVQAHQAAEEAMAETPDAEPAPERDDETDHDVPVDATPDVAEPADPSWLTSWRSRDSNQMWLENGKVHIALTPLGTVGTCIVLIVLMAVAYAWGHAFGVRAGEVQAREQIIADHVGSIAQAKKLRPDSSVLDLSGMPGTGAVDAAEDSAPAARAETTASTGKPSPPARPGPSGKVIRQKGWNYLVIQHFGGKNGQTEAKKAERFINENLPPVNGQPPVTAEALSDGSYMLLSTLGYKSGDDASKEAVEQFSQQIRRIGKEYKKQGSGYDFQDCYPMQR